MRNFRQPMRTLSLIVVGLAAAGAIAAGSQQESKGTDLSKVERKNLAPVSREVLKVTLPRLFETTLSNGLSVIILEDHRLPLASAQLNISAAGPLFEPAELPGLAGITAQMLREGAGSRTSLQIAEEVDRLAASLNFSAGFGSSATVMSASGQTDNLDQWMELAADVLLNPTFPSQELDRIKQRMKAQLRQQRSSPSFLSNERFSRAIFASHPAAVTSTNEAAIDGFTVDRLRDWHRRYTPQNAILGIAGDVRPAQIVPKLEKWFGPWKKTDMKEVLPPNPLLATAKKVHLVDRPGSVQTSLMMGNLAVERKDPDYIPLVVMNRILGGGPAARLFINLREEKGYSYGVYSTFSALKYPGAFRAYGDVRTEVTDGALTEFFKEFARIRDEKVSDAELDEAKRATVAGFALSLEDLDQLLNYGVIRRIYGFSPDYWDTYPARIMAVTADDIQRVAKKYVNLDKIQIVAVGDGAKIKSTLEKYGPVEMFNAEAGAPPK